MRLESRQEHFIVREDRGCGHSGFFTTCNLNSNNHNFVLATASYSTMEL